MCFLLSGKKLKNNEFDIYAESGNFKFLKPGQAIFIRQHSKEWLWVTPREFKEIEDRLIQIAQHFDYFGTFNSFGHLVKSVSNYPEYVKGKR